jgi:GH15 family glucan-1,4-alpha-glucosidase
VICRIQDYAIIGDCRSAALVSRDGSMDWLCWPRFDSAALFASILDEDAGRWSISPTAPFRVTRRYVEGTNVLETLFETTSGTLLLTDLMPVASEEEKGKLLVADHQIIRQLECQRGEVEVEVLFRPRPGFGQQPVRLRDAGKLGVRAETSSGLLTLRSDLPLSVSSHGEMRTRVCLCAGDVRQLSLTFDDESLAVLTPLGKPIRDAIQRSIKWWRAWASKLSYEGPCREAVLRSALTLKLLVYAPSGAIVAAPTTSLPERLGGSLNWDYRFCWLRDAALTMRALFGLGFAEEAEAFLSWLLHSTRLTQPELRILYDVYGNKPKPERTLRHLSGHRGSSPVRLGNAAADQLQLDVYGEVIDAVAQFVRQGGALDKETQRMLRSFGEYVCRNWRRADEGIWEPRSGKAHHTHSRVLCWTALDRLIELAAQGHMQGAPIEHFRSNREVIRTELERRAWNSQLQSYVARLDGDDVDASLLLLPWYGFEKASSERMKHTYHRILERLGTAHSLLFRYRDTDSAGEGAFGIGSFWGAEYLALGGGSAEQALSAFEDLVALGNEVGLFAEEIDPQTGDALGNFPQAFTHVGLINAAISLSKRLEGQQSVDQSVRERHESTHSEVRL